MCDTWTVIRFVLMLAVPLAFLSGSGVFACPVESDGAQAASTGGRSELVSSRDRSSELQSHDSAVLGTTAVYADERANAARFVEVGTDRVVENFEFLIDHCGDDDLTHAVFSPSCWAFVGMKREVPIHAVVLRTSRRVRVESGEESGGHECVDADCVPTIELIRVEARSLQAGLTLALVDQKLQRGYQWRTAVLAARRGFVLREVLSRGGQLHRRLSVPRKLPQEIELERDLSIGAMQLAASCGPLDCTDRIPIRARIGQFESAPKAQCKACFSYVEAAQFGVLFDGAKQ
jgi:hypothetical protein